MTTGATVKIKNVSPIGALEVVALRRVVKAGEVFDCPTDIAGTEPGTWRPPTDAERGNGLRGVTKRRAPGKDWEVQDQGRGLLAQPANFVRVDTAPSNAAPKSGAEGK